VTRTSAIRSLALFLLGAGAISLGLTARAPVAHGQSGEAVSSHLFLPANLASFDVARRPRPVVVPSATPPPSATPSPTASIAATPTVTPEPTATPTPEGYAEPLPTFDSLDDLRTGYRGADWYDTMLQILERRYPAGRHIVTRVDNSQARAKYWAGSRTSTFDDLIHVLQHVVHEMNHELGIQEGVDKTGFKTYVYVVRDDLQLEAPYFETFPRSEISQYVTGSLENMYKPNYLSGPLGRMGFQNTLDEVNAYTHSLFTAYSVHDQFPRNERASYRDGIVTFLMYTQFYLRHARLRHPDTWAALHDDDQVREVVRVLWERANFILDVTENIPGLALEAEAVEAEMRKAEMQAEVDLFLAP
jgi:hypothetical protein